MDAVVFERRKNGIFLSGHRVLRGKIPFGTTEPKPIEGTPWTLLHVEDFQSAGDSSYKTTDRLRLAYPARGTDVIAIDVARGHFQFQFFSILAPSIRYDGSSVRLYDGDEMVAEHINAWRDRDDEAGILARVETHLIGPAADAAAILLFHLVDRPVLSVSGPAPEPDPPMGF